MGLWKKSIFYVFMLLRRQGANRQMRRESHGRYRENFVRSVFSHRNFPAVAMGTFSDLKNNVLEVKFWKKKIFDPKFQNTAVNGLFWWFFYKKFGVRWFFPTKSSSLCNGHMFGPEKISFGGQILKKIKKKTAKKSIFSKNLTSRTNCLDISHYYSIIYTCSMMGKN